MKYTILTLGCKVNQFETSSMEKLLADRGHIAVKSGEADAVIVNSCAVTAESGRKSRQALRRLIAENPGAISAVCGCYSQISPKEAEEIGADIVFGSGDRLGFVDALEDFHARRKKIIRVDDPFAREKIERLSGGAMEGRTRAHMKIVDGCDNYCSYCIIPYARGHVRSMPLADCAVEASRLMAEGFREIVVTGIEISSYGRDLPGKPGLADAIKAIAASAPGARIHIGSLEPTIIDENFCTMLSEAGNICPHFHLALQSGCDKTLKNMNRKYDTKRFFEACQLLRKYFPDCALSADLICGFPGETESDHAEAMAFIRKCAFASMHIFPYSIRPGTAAASMSGQLDKAEKSKRAKEAQSIAAIMQRDYLEAMVGRTMSVLFETDKDGVWTGHSENYCEVLVIGENLHGFVRNVKILSAEKTKLRGIIV